MSLKVGDTVEILGVKKGEDLKGQPYCWDDSLMLEFIGSITLITKKLRDGWYEVDADENRYVWKESWLWKIDSKAIPEKPPEVEATKTYTVTWEEHQEDIIERSFFGLIRSRPIRQPNKKFKASCNARQKELIEKNISRTSYPRRLLFWNSIGKRLNIEIVQDLPKELEAWFSQVLEKE